jgi:hypothetical protein
VMIHDGQRLSHMCRRSTAAEANYFATGLSLPCCYRE